MPKKKSESLPWYSDGLKFTCSGCGDCCTGSPGYVWVNQAEMQALADELKMGLDEFIDQYTRKIGIRRSLKEFPKTWDCVFLGEDRKCTVYAARPRQCRTWPFWDSNLKTPDDWERTCEVCPGSGTGKLHQLTHIEAQRSEVKI